MAREYKDSGIEWIGQIPKEWEVGNIKHYCNSIFAGGTPQSNNEEYWDGDIPWIPSGSCKNNFIFSAPKFITQAGLENSSTKLIPSGTTVMAMTGATCSNVGYVLFDTCMNQSVVAYLEKKDTTSSKFLFYLLQGAQEEILTHKTGGAQSGINVDDCKNIIVPFLSLSEQQKIADYLDKICGEVDEMVALQETMIEELKAYKQSVITEAVTKGLNPNVPMKDSGIDWIGEIPEHWEVCRFKDIASVKANLVHPDDYMDFPQIAPDNIEKASGRLLPYKSVKESNVISDNHLFFKGQIIYSKIRPVLNKLIIAPFDGLCSADMYPIETTNDINYQKYYMLSDAFVRQVALVVQDRVKMPKINQNELSIIYVLSLPLSEQRSIASYLDTKCTEIDSLIALKQQKIEELKDYKKSVIYEYVTGKKEVC